MTLIGRKRECDALDRCLGSGRPEFVAVYGRRRVGKTYLVREYFRDGFAFYATGLAGENMRAQLRVFGDALRESGDEQDGVPADWFEAFARLKALLASDRVRRDRASGRIVVFLDELPWFDTPRSQFKAALEHFWNSWASARDDVMLVVCGSATSWIVTNLIDDYGGLHNRITRQLRLLPFTLCECERYCEVNGIPFTRRQIVECYMVFGGVPYYLNLIDRRLSLAQNVELLCFDEAGQLRHEFERLYRSLFKKPGRHIAIIRQIAKTRHGSLRSELEKVAAIGGGQPLTKALVELEQCGFIRKYQDFTRRKSGFYYQIVDPFTLFALRFLEGGEVGSWMSYLGSPSYRSWSGYAFELVCLAHVRQMKAALGIAAVETREASWRSRQADPGAQVDLLIDRKDGVVNVCEMKFSSGEYAIDAACERSLRNKLDAFAREAAPDKALLLTMVTVDGVARNKHFGIVANEVDSDGLFLE